MSSSDSEFIAEFVAIYQGVKTVYTINVAVVSLLVYDALLCIEKEVLYVWRAPKAERKLSRFLYIYNRYMSVLWNLLEMGMLVTLSDVVYIRCTSDSATPTSCRALVWLPDVMKTLAMLGPALFTTLRVYALSGRHKILTSVVLLLSTGPFVINVVTAYQRVAINLPLPYGCSIELEASINTFIALSVLSRICLILGDAVAVVVTWWRTRTARQTSTDVLRQSSLEIIIWDNGNVYFCTIVMMNVADMILAVLSIRGTQLDNLAYVVNFLDPISSILNSRFLLALYETNAHLESGGTSASSFSTLDFREGNTPAGSVALPGYLSSLAGPIYSVPDDGSELFDSDSTQQHEPKGVVGAEVKADLEQVNAGASDRDSIEEVERLEQV